MMHCPECNSENLEVSTEVAYLTSSTYKIINGKIQGFKKSDLKNPPLFEIRVFIRCAECGYETENANHSHGSNFETNFVEDIANKITDMIREPKQKRETDFNKKYNKYFQNKPSHAEIIDYLNKNKRSSRFNIEVFKAHLDKYLNGTEL